MKLYPYKKVGRGNPAAPELKVLAILMGGYKSFPPFRRVCVKSFVTLSWGGGGGGAAKYRTRAFPIL